MWHMGDGWGWWMVMGWLWMVVFWGLIIWGVVMIVRRSNEGGSSSTMRSAEPSATEILERRYARGEISGEEFESMRSRLTGELPASGARDERAGEPAMR